MHVLLISIDVVWLSWSTGEKFASHWQPVRHGMKVLCCCRCRACRWRSGGQGGRLMSHRASRSLLLSGAGAAQKMVRPCPEFKPHTRHGPAVYQPYQLSRHPQPHESQAVDMEEHQQPAHAFPTIVAENVDLWVVGNGAGRSTAATESFRQQPSSSGALLDLPEQRPLGSPAFIAVATTSYLRVYPADCLQVRSCQTQKPHSRYTCASCTLF